MYCKIVSVILISFVCNACRDAEMASVGQLLDVIMDLEKVHDAYEKMELEKQRHSFRSDTSQIRE